MQSFVRSLASSLPFARWSACALAALFALGMPPGPARAAPEPVLQLRIVGGLGGVNQFIRHEAPFWTERLPRDSAGRYGAEIVPFDRAGIRAEESLRLVQLGVVPFGTVLLSVSAADEPLLAAPDLAGLNPDMASLRRTVAAFRPQLVRTLRERHGVELLALYVYPAQVVFCNAPIARLADLAGKRVRTSSPAQSDLVEALGGVAVRTAFAELMPNMRSGNLQCAITGTMSGNTIGLHEVSTHLHPMAVSWGLSAFVANRAAWQRLPDDLRGLLERSLPQLERDIWDESDRETGGGIACSSGSPSCVGGRRGQIAVVPVLPDDDQRRRAIFASTVLPRWLQRCGPSCAEVWNATIGPVAGIAAPR